MISDKELDNLILARKQYSLIKSKDWPLEALRELKERRESDLVPATKFLKEPLSEHVRKVMEECDEVVDASDDEMDLYLEEGSIENLKHLIEELIDVQMAVETAITKILPNVEDRLKARRQVREKNNKRGYYE